MTPLNMLFFDLFDNLRVYIRPRHNEFDDGYSVTYSHVVAILSEAAREGYPKALCAYCAVGQTVFPPIFFQNSVMLRSCQMLS